jgi:hypothetical protein
VLLREVEVLMPNSAYAVKVIITKENEQADPSDLTLKHITAMELPVNEALEFVINTLNVEVPDA